MASSTYRCRDLQHIVYQPRADPKISYPALGFLQIELTVTLQLLRRLHYCVTDQFIDLDDQPPIFSQETIRFDLRALDSYDRTFRILAPMLVRLRINPNPQFIDEIIRQGLSIGTLESNEGREVFPLQADLWGTSVEHVPDEEEEDLTERALEESASEFETSNYNMVPAKDSSVKKMLKRVRVEPAKRGKKQEKPIKKRRLEAENCVICLEELKVGSDAFQMPCSHTFHGECIKKWLKQSHYCPVCRFEMPTE
ncbi:hypothetical protein POUND7_007320 [Theobroma cacao]